MTEGDLPTTSYILLGLLASRDWSAYQLAEQVGRGVEHVWPGADRQRYRTLTQLRDSGLVTARTEADGGRSRSIYSITDAGRTALAGWLATPVPTPALEFEGILRVMLADEGTLDDLRRTLELTRRRCTEGRTMFARHAAFIAATGGVFPERGHLSALANTFIIGHYDHLIAWASWALEEVSTWPDVRSPASDPALVRRLLSTGIAAFEET